MVVPVTSFWESRLDLFGKLECLSSDYWTPWTDILGVGIKPPMFF